MASDRKSAKTRDANTLAETIGLYALGEISLGKAAERAVTSRWEMKDVLKDAGVQLRLGPQTEEELEDDVETALDFG